MTVLHLDGADLPAALAAAQAALLAAPPGSSATWVVPDGDHVLAPADLRLGAGDRALELRGDPDRPAPVLRVHATDAGAALSVTGTTVAISRLMLDVTADDAVQALHVQAGAGAAVSDVSVAVSGRAAVAVDIVAGEAAQVIATRVTGARATAGDATGVRVRAAGIRLHRVDVAQVDAQDTATGVDGHARDPGGTTLSASAVRVGTVTGARAAGATLRAGDIAAADPLSPGPAAALLTVLDATADTITSRQRVDRADGLDLASAGDIDARGLSARHVTGAPARGVGLLAGGGVRWSGGTIDDVRGGTGADGAVVVASASRRSLAVDDVQVEQVFAAGQAGNVGGVRVLADVSDQAQWVDDDTDPGAVFVTGCVVRRVSGTALVLDVALRDAELRGVEVWTAARAAVLAGERITVANTTWHRFGHGVEVGPCELTLVDSLITGVTEGTALVAGAEALLDVVAATWVDPPPAGPPLLTVPDGTPYRDAGPVGIPAALVDGGFVPAAGVDLRLAPRAGLHELAVRVPGDSPDVTPFAGAHPPAQDPGCVLRDPLPPALPEVAPQARPGPVIDLRARDARGLLDVMRARAHTVLPGWVDGDAADLTTMLLELLANRLDRMSYAQESTLAEAAIGTARLRRSVEDHARLVDYRPDPGLSATTMVRVRVEPASYGALGLAHPGQAAIRSFVLDADTVVVNPDAGEQPVVFSTEEALLWHAALDTLTLADDVPPGATQALLAGDLLDLAPLRWLVLVAADPRDAAHVVRVTQVEVTTDTTRIWWDPRRPAPRQYRAGGAVLGNVVPAHHGLRLSPALTGLAAEPGFAETIGALVDAMTVELDNRDGRRNEVALPVGAASRVAPGWPLPAEAPRSGTCQVEVAVDGEPWRMVEDLATEPGEVFALRSAGAAGTTLVLGQPGVLPRRHVSVAIAARLGLGAVGNLGPGTLTSLLALGAGSTLDRTVPAGADVLALAREHVRVDNPVPAIGGRDPEPLARIRRRAPRAARTLVSAVAAADYGALLEELPEVAGARARVDELGERRVVRATLLLTDEDTLTAGDDGDLDPRRDAERLRRWALARRRLEDIRLLGFDVQLLPPAFVPIDLDLAVDAASWAPAEALHARVADALTGAGGLFDPDTSGLGGDVSVDAILRRVLAVDGVVAARVNRLRRLLPDALEHAVDGTLPIGADEVAVLRRPYGAGEDGQLTVEICGGVR